MKYEKILTESLKNLLNGKVMMWFCDDIIDDCTYITNAAGTVAYKMPNVKADFINYGYRGREPNKALEDIFNNAVKNATICAVDTHIEERIPGDYRTKGKAVNLRKLSSPDGEVNVYFNADLVKNFEDPVFYIESPLKPIVVYEYGAAVGIILPVRHN